jgi:hypothetical protein
MKRHRLLIGFVPIVLLLSACNPTTPAPSDSASPAAPASQTASPAAPSPAAAITVSAADYITDGAVGSGNDAWSVLYSFYTDASKTVLCAIAANSESPAAANCWVVKGKESQVTYNVPPPITGQCDTNDPVNYRGDGYQVGLGLFQAIGQDAGFYGCREIETETPAVLTASKVIPDNATIATEDLTCTVTGGIAKCGYTTSGNVTSFTFGLSVATFTF